MPSVSSLPSGKVTAEVLRRSVLPYLGASTGRCLSGPAVGEDAPMLDLGDRVLVVKSNPITGAERHIGLLAVHINGNDVATRGARPLWFLSVILLPPGTPEKALAEITREIHAACLTLGVEVIGGHTECAPQLTKPVVVGTMIGEAQKGSQLTSRGAQQGDRLILTKGAGVEGTGILASDLTSRLRRKVEKGVLNSARGFIERVSVVPEALEAVRAGGVHAMHTPTEGGVINGLLELAEASGTGFTVYEDWIPVAAETRRVCEALGADPLRLITSGSLLISVDPRKAPRVVKAIEAKGVPAATIGSVTGRESGRTLVKKDGSKQRVEPVRQDELYRLLSG